VEIEVADRGPGIAEKDRDRVIGRFVRLENSRSRPGSGLGLSLASAVARLHGGTLRIEDNEPGLRVVLVLPSRAPATGSAVAPPSPAIAAPSLASHESSAN
ncbi:MAG: two-component sensor histidine kinase, partial [Methylocystaceae bacterium]